jgi:hypothetical protein
LAQTSITRHGQAKPPAYWETIRDRIDTARASENLNLMASGTELPSQQERVSLFIINKMLPSLQAVAVEVTHRSAASMHDLHDRATALGLDPSMLLGDATLIESMPSTDDTPEDSIASPDSIEAPLPPDSDA